MELGSDGHRLAPGCWEGRPIIPKCFEEARELEKRYGMTGLIRIDYCSGANGVEGVVCGVWWKHLRFNSGAETPYPSSFRTRTIHRPPFDLADALHACSFGRCCSQTDSEKWWMREPRAPIWPFGESGCQEIS
ncbi:hypothetical protein HYFRA_00009697 [Hymenoscyphus fraxineus]|uniref:Uncharacterized protein n=1 Tax=Hymenoscyphus fraxineus TaxID=746836 RepID=A0A9N9KT18_9HELO|nr:hypothetical protein HYFRA_00009697 [Hymenoscyphus fraxineus]